ncbi:PAS domain-containing protein [Pontibacter lucknowensis]|nr:PAS domain-containing protein [Pontibacter lucknowensis]
MNNMPFENLPGSTSPESDAVLSPSTESASVHAIPFLHIFQSQSGSSLLLSPQFVVEAATDALLKEIFMTREDIVGKYLFDAFPDNPGSPHAFATINLRASLDQVLATGKPHRMDLQQYDISDPQQPGQFLERYWNVTNIPIFDEGGKVAYILHETTNVSDQIVTERKLAESLVREKRATALGDQQRFRLERLFEQAPAALAILEGPDFVYKEINDSYQKLFPGRKLVGLPLFEALPELENQPIAGIIRNVYQTGVTFEGKEVLIPVARYEDQPVENIYWNFIYQAIYNTKGEVDGILIFALDVTEFIQTKQELEQKSESLLELNRELEGRVKTRTRELQRAEAEAERQRKRLENLFMKAPAAICIVEGPELVYTLVNPVYEGLFPERKLLGRPILEALPEIEHNLVYKSFREVYEQGNTHEESELLIPFVRPADGVIEDRYFRFILQAKFNDQKQVDGVVVFALEVTEQVKSRIAVEASEQQLKLITDSLPVLIGYLDREERYRFANKAYEKWFLVDSQELLGKTVREVVGEPSYHNVKANIQRALAGEMLDFEATMPYREDFVKHIQVSYIPDCRGGMVHGFYTLVTDVTEQVNARKALEESEQKAKTMAEKLAVTNHELNLANSELEDNNRDLENRVLSRTAALQNTNELLKEHIKERKKTSESLSKSHEQLQALTRHLQVMREEERKYIARELHDELGQAFTALKIDVTLLLKTLAKGHVKQEVLQEELQSMMKTINSSIASVRKIVATLRPAVLDNFGLLSELESQAQDFQKRSSIQMDVLSYVDYVELENEKSIEVFRIMQESMTNIVRHSGASKASIQIAKTNSHFCFTIEDNGKGLQDDKLSGTRTFGLLGMQERAERIGASLSIESKQNKGTRLTLEVPFD